MRAHFKGENGIEDYMAHEAVIVGSLGGKTPGYFLVLMILRAGPGGEIVEQSLVIRNDSQLFLNWLCLMIHTKSATVN